MRVCLYGSSYGSVCDTPCTTVTHCLGAVVLMLRALLLVHGGWIAALHQGFNTHCQFVTCRASFMRCEQPLRRLLCKQASGIASRSLMDAHRHPTHACCSQERFTACLTQSGFDLRIRCGANNRLLTRTRIIALGCGCLVVRHVESMRTLGFGMCVVRLLI